MDNFEQFWAAWPKSFRKGGKSKCQDDGKRVCMTIVQIKSLSMLFG